MIYSKVEQTENKKPIAFKGNGSQKSVTVTQIEGKYLPYFPVLLQTEYQDA